MDFCAGRGKLCHGIIYSNKKKTKVWTEACFSGPEIQKALFSQIKKFEAT